MAKNSSDRRARMREGVVKRQQESQRTVEGDRQFTKFFDPQKIRGVTLWNPGAGEHAFDVIPYEAGDNDPKADPGEVTYVLDVYVHRNVGPKDKQMLCPQFNWDQDCPICEERNRRRKADPDDEDYKNLFPTRRVVYNVIVRDSPKEAKKGVQVFEVAHYFVERNIQAVATRSKRQGGGTIPFADVDTGNTISFKRVGTDKNTKFEGFVLEEREEKIADEDLDAAYTLDDLIHVPTADEIAREYWAKPSGGGEDGAAEPEEDEEETPRRSRSGRRAAAEDEEPEPEEEAPRRSRSRSRDEDTEPADEGEDEAPPRRSRRSRSSEDEEPEPEPEPEDEAPRRRRVSKAEEPSEDEESPPRRSRRSRSGGDDGEGEEEAPRRSRRRSRSSEDEESESEPEPAGDDPVCPADGVFGQDVDKFDECEKCEVYDDCLATYQANKPKRRGRAKE